MGVNGTAGEQHLHGPFPADGADQRGFDVAHLHMGVVSPFATDAAFVVTRMRLPATIVESSLRFSLGAFTTRQDIDNAVDRMVEVVRRLRRAQHRQVDQSPV